jgi:hypothetical protein
MLMLGNLFKESGVVRQLSETASNALMYIVVILLGTSVGASTSAEAFLNLGTLKIVALGLVAFAFGTAAGVLLGKLMCVLTHGKVNPLIGAAGVSAVPMAARVAQKVGAEEDPTNFLTPVEKQEYMRAHSRTIMNPGAVEEVRDALERNKTAERQNYCQKPMPAGRRVQNSYQSDQNFGRDDMNYSQGGQDYDQNGMSYSQNDHRYNQNGMSYNQDNLGYNQNDMSCSQDDHRYNQNGMSCSQDDLEYNQNGGEYYQPDQNYGSSDQQYDYDRADFEDEYYRDRADMEEYREEYSDDAHPDILALLPRILGGVAAVCMIVFAGVLISRNFFPPVSDDEVAAQESRSDSSSASQTSDTEEPGAAPAKEVSGTSVHTTSDLNLRTSPEKTDNIAKAVKAGTQLTLVGEENGWAKVYYDGEYFYCSKKFLSE